MMMTEELPDLTHLENKLGRKVPESLMRSLTAGPEIRSSLTAGPEIRSSLTAGPEIRSSLTAGPEIRSSLTAGPEIRSSLTAGPEIRSSLTAGPEIRSSETQFNDLQTLSNKLSFLRQQMAHLRAIDVKLMHQLLSINEGIESIRWVMEERGGVASREGSMTGSLYSLSDSQDASHHGSCSDGLDDISVGSYLDTLGEDEPDPSSPFTLLDTLSGKPAVEEEMFKKPRVEADEYYCFG